MLQPINRWAYPIGPIDSSMTEPSQDIGDTQAGLSNLCLTLGDCSSPNTTIPATLSPTTTIGPSTVIGPTTTETSPNHQVDSPILGTRPVLEIADIVTANPNNSTANNTQSGATWQPGIYGGGGAGSSASSTEQNQQPTTNNSIYYAKKYWWVGALILTSGYIIMQKRKK